MGKHGRKGRKFRKYLKGQIQHSFDLGTLGGNDLIGSLVGDVVEEKAYCSSVKASYALQDWATGGDDGPIVVGVAHGGYSDAEIEEWIETTDSWARGNLRVQEIAKRMIRRIGMFETPSGTNLVIPLNDGKPITTKLGWVLVTGQTLRFWAYNTGSQTITGGKVIVQGHANLWPQ